MEKFNRQSRKSKVDKFAEKVDVSEKWKAHEKEAAKSFKGETTIGSGNKDFYKGDVKSDVFLAECVPKGSRIKVGFGKEVAIQDINIGDMVVGSDGRLHKVLNTFKRSYDGEVYNICRYGSMDRLVVTPEHPVFSRCSCCKEERFRKPENIFHGMRLFVPVLKIDENVIDRDDDYLKVGGYFVSEGNSCLTGGKEKRPGRAQFTFGSTEMSYMEELLQSLIRLYGRAFKPRTTLWNTITGSFCSVKDVPQIEKDFGKTAHFKLIPDWMFNQKNNHLFISRLFRGDGHDYGNCMGLSTVSKDVASKLVDILHSWKVANAVTKSGREKSLYIIRCYCDSYVRMKEIIGKIPLGKDNDGSINRIRFLGEYDKDLDGFWYFVRSVNKEHFSGMVYNLEVDGTNDYVCNGVVVHNCKTTVSRHWTFKVDWLEKINDEALGRMRFPAMHLRFDGIDQGSCEKDWVLLPDSVFKMMLEAFGEYDVR